MVVVGLGPGGPDLLTVAATEAIAAHPVRFVRTSRHPAATALAGATAFDDVYEAAAAMDEVYATIVDRLLDAAARHGTVLYAVPGSPLVGERSVELLVESAAAGAPVEVELVAGLSFVDLAWLRLGVDPVAVGARVVDGHRFDAESAGSSGALLVAQCDHSGVLEAIKLVVGDAVDRSGVDPPPLHLCAHLGLPTEEVRPVVWHELDRAVPDHLTSVWIPPLGATLSGSFVRLDDLVRRLRSDCPWDRAQTHGSLRPHLLEETHEVLEALDALAAVEAADVLGSADGIDATPDVTSDVTIAPDGAEALDDAYVLLEEELGDLLFQVVFHACLATEAGRFTLADVADGIAGKLVARHPHVFGDVEADTPEDVRARWEEIKKAEKGRASVLDGIPAGLPALALAAKVLRKASSIPGGVDVLDTAATEGGGGDEAVVGDRLLAEVAAASALGVDPEAALRAAVGRRIASLRAAESAQAADEPDPES